jgi:signal transduction histidine kinase/ligand-binding sensor domain-containing protein/DNA-binding response OmpR family regulator
MTKSYLLHIVAFLFSFTVIFSQTEYEFQAYKRKDGLSNSSVFAIEQDSEGFMWFGTRDGINRFDGFQFKNFKSTSTNSGMVSNDIRNVVYDSVTNSMFIGTLGGVSVLNLDNYNFNNYSSSTDNNSLGNNLIKAIHIDKKKRIWIGTGNGIHLYNRKNQTFKRFLFNNPNPINVESILELRDGLLLVGTNKGIYKLAEKNQILDFQKIDVKGAQMYVDINNQNIKTLVEDKRGYIWIGTFENGLFKWDRQKGIVNSYNTNTYPSLTNNSIRAVAVDSNNQLWVGTFNGLNIIKDGAVNQYLSNEANKNSISDNSIKNIFIDRHHNVWIGTYYGGVNLVTKKAELFKSYIYNENENKGFDGKVVSSFCEDNKNNIWIGTEGSGLYYLDRQKGSIEKFKKQNFEKNNIKKILLHKDNLYLGLFNNGFSIIDLETNSIKNKAVGYSYNVHGGGNNVYDILSLDSLLFINAFGECIETYNPSSGTSKKLTSLFSKLSSRNVRCFLKSPTNNSIWIGTEKGLNKVVLKSDGSYLIEYFFNEEKIYSLLEDNEHHLWIGTFDNGLIKFNYQDKKTSRIDENLGLIGKSIFGLQYDNENIWASTEQGISKINKKNLAITNYNSSSGLKVTEYNYNASCKTSDGMLLFGGIGGFTMFDPKQIVENFKISDVKFTDLKQNNIIINPNEKSKILSKNINQSESIELPYSNSSFTIGFSTLDYKNKENNHLLYKLENFDKSWIRATGRNEVSYTIQQPGSYTFRIKGETSNGMISEKEKTLQIIVSPPFWKSNLAYLLYLLLSLLAGYSAYKFLKIRHNLQLENMARIQQEELNESKLRFFTNITHEFRTPLTLINGPVDYLLEKSNDPDVTSSLNIIQKNAKRLLSLVNQILQFRKMEAGHEKLSLNKVNIVTFLGEIFEIFEIAAKEKNVTFTFDYEQPNITLHFDIDKMEKVIYNLLANAFKFTQKNGKISFSVRLEGQNTVIEVKDNGPGVPIELQEQIFYRFYEKAPHVFFETKGTGIGLAISKEMVEMHKGSLEVKSEENQGATFIIKLPNDASLFNTEDINTIKEVELIKPKIDLREFIDAIKNDEKGNTIDNKFEQNTKEWIEDLPLILIVEDNYDVREFVVNVLQSQFNILQATNGADALKLCLKYSPDVVVSDVMMPIMDGIALLQSIKSRIEISHIPVILLTAKDNIEGKLQGLSEGADDYLTKPFSPEELSLRIHNLIKIKKIAIEKFSKVINLDPKEITISNADEIFLDSLLEHLERNMDNSNYVVDQLAMDMTMSRSVLFSKIKKLTEMTPNNFIKSFKLKRAAALLKSGRLNVSEVCYKIGFKDQKYFRKLFFQEFGVNPSDYYMMDEKSFKNLN